MVHFWIFRERQFKKKKKYRIFSNIALDVTNFDFSIFFFLVFFFMFFKNFILGPRGTFKISELPFFPSIFVKPYKRELFFQNAIAIFRESLNVFF